MNSNEFGLEIIVTNHIKKEIPKIVKTLNRKAKQKYLLKITKRKLGTKEKIVF